MYVVFVSCEHMTLFRLATLNIVQIILVFGVIVYVEKTLFACFLNEKVAAPL